MNGHKMQSITIADVAVVKDHPTLIDGQPIVVKIGPEETQVGCKVCGLSLTEALDQPLPCPGFSMGDVLDKIEAEQSPGDQG